MELWGMWSTPTLPLPFCPEVVVPIMGQIELFNLLLEIIIDIK